MDQSTATMGWMGESFTVIPNYVMKDDRVDKAALLTYVALRSFMGGEDMVCFPSIPKIADRARTSQNTIRMGIERLQDIGYIVIEVRTTENGDRTSNIYRLLGKCPSDCGGGPSDLKEGPSKTIPPSFKNDRVTISNEEEPSNKILPTPLATVSKKKEYASRVHLTEFEYSALCTRFTKSVVDAAIQTLDAYKEAHGRSYKSDAGALRQWAIPATNERLLKAAKFGGVPASVNPKFGGRVCPKCGELNTHSGGMCLKCNEDLPRRKA